MSVTYFFRKCETGVCRLEGVISIYSGNRNVLKCRVTSKGSTYRGEGKWKLCPNETEREAIK